MTPDLDKITEDAYKDKEKLLRLQRSHNLQWIKVIQRIVDEHFKRINNKQLPLFR